LQAAHEVPGWVKALPIVAAVVGIAVAYALYMARPALAAVLASRFRGLYLFLLNKWYFDELYDRLFVRPAKAIGYGLWKGGDGAVIDGLGPDGISAVTLDLARRAKLLQSGYLYHYAFAMLVGVAGLVTWYLVYGGN
ncbi:MAG: NADH-quinone oxidoreductase subunit L, partial [Alphaproteobacteria bacterium]